MKEKEKKKVLTKRKKKLERNRLMSRRNCEIVQYQLSQNII